MKKSVKELRDIRDQLVGDTSTHHNQIAESMKLISAGETSEMIASALTEIDMLNSRSEESSWKTRLKRLLPFNAAEKIEEKVRLTHAQGSTVKEVTEQLLSAVTKKRETVEGIMGGLFGLYDHMETAYTNVKAFGEGLNESLQGDTYNNEEKFHLNSMLAETLEYASIIQENLGHCKNTIQAGQVSVQQIAGLQPKLKAQLSDGLSILVGLEELSQLTDTCKAIEEMCDVLRSENRERVASAQLTAIERHSGSENIKAIEKNLNRNIELTSEIAKRQMTLNEETVQKVEVLKKAVDRGHEKLVLSTQDDMTRIQKITDILTEN